MSQSAKLFFLIDRLLTHNFFEIATNAFPLKAGMTVSNEPGYYEDGKFGIRIESVVLVREVKTPNNFGDKGFLGFENVTMYASFFFLFFISIIPNAF